MNRRNQIIIKVKYATAQCIEKWRKLRIYTFLVCPLPPRRWSSNVWQHFCVCNLARDKGLILRSHCALPVIAFTWAVTPSLIWTLRHPIHRARPPIQRLCHASSTSFTFFPRRSTVFKIIPNFFRFRSRFLSHPVDDGGIYSKMVQYH